MEREIDMINKVFFKVIIPLWVLIVVINFVLPKKDFSDMENRNLARLPHFSYVTLINGTFMQKVDDFINDHFIGRDNWVGIKGQMEYLLGKHENNGIFISSKGLVENMKKPNNDYTNKNIEGIKAFVSDAKIPTYLMIVPSAADIQKYKLPLFATAYDQKSYITDVYTKLKGTLKTINVYDTLYKHQKEYIYYTTDHHWTTDGAFLAYKSAREVMLKGVGATGEYTKDIVSCNFYGTLYSKAGFRNVAPDSITEFKNKKGAKVTSFTTFDGKTTKVYPSIYFEEFLQKKDKYSYFLGVIQPISIIKTDCTSGKKLLIFKDSYAHAFVPFLINDYSEITLVDLRFINTSYKDFLNPSDYNSALFLYSFNVFSHMNEVSKLTW